MKTWLFKEQVEMQRKRKLGSVSVSVSAGQAGIYAEGGGGGRLAVRFVCA